MAGDLLRQGQEEAYNELRKVVEEQGLTEELDKTGKKAGTFMKVSAACLFAHYMGKTKDGGIRLKIYIKRVQPMVKWFW